jgi:hypothetical protein
LGTKKKKKKKKLLTGKVNSRRDAEFPQHDKNLCGFCVTSIYMAWIILRMNISLIFLYLAVVFRGQTKAAGARTNRHLKPDARTRRAASPLPYDIFKTFRDLIVTSPRLGTTTSQIRIDPIC